MNTFESTIGIINSTAKPRVVWVEPWDSDYTLLPGERLEITIRDETRLPWFVVEEQDAATRIHIEPGTLYYVTQGGRHLVNGHNRGAGSAPPAVTPSPSSIVQGHPMW